MKTGIVLALLLYITATSAFAHSNSDSYLQLDANKNTVVVRLDIALRDLDHTIGLDTDQDGQLTWAEVRIKHREIAALVRAGLSIEADRQKCRFGPVEHLINKHNETAYAVLKMTATCPASPTGLTVGYSLLFEQNPRHRGLMKLAFGDRRHIAVFSPESRSIAFLTDGKPSVSFRSFFIKGVEHLVGGIDHLLFLFVLLLPSVMWHRSGNPNRRHNFRQEVFDVVKILTAFTVAHAVTLTVSVLGIIRPPATPVEVIIAISVAVTALDNIRSFLGPRRWLIAGCFGLIHGFGFANALGPLDLSAKSLFTALLAFNLGLEAAQIMIAGLLLPLGYFLFQRREAIAGLSLKGGSVAAFLVATLWTLDRSLGLEMMPF